MHVMLEEAGDMFLKCMVRGHVNGFRLYAARDCL